jgi:hypothetical protein
VPLNEEISGIIDRERMCTTIKTYTKCNSYFIETCLMYPCSGILNRTVNGLSYGYYVEPIGLHHIMSFIDLVWARTQTAGCV